MTHPKIVLVGALAAACGGSATEREAPPSLLLYPADRVSVSLPPGTMRLGAAVVDGLGQPVTPLVAPAFVAEDTAIARVTADGQLTARRGGETRVFVTATAPGGRKLADTMHVTVVSLGGGRARVPPNESLQLTWRPSRPRPSTVP
jgi:hypothetical protein